MALNAIAGIAVALAPYLPFTTPQVFTMLGIPEEPHWHPAVVPAGARLGEAVPLFTKLDPTMLAAEDDEG